MQEIQRHQLYTLFVLLREKTFLDLFFKILEATQITSEFVIEKNAKAKDKIGWIPLKIWKGKIRGRAAHGSVKWFVYIESEKKITIQKKIV